MDRAVFEALDREDPLGAARAAFALPDDLIYLDGNSLGAMPTRVPARLERVLHDEWGAGLIRSWNAADWVSATRRVAAALARLVGAHADEIALADSTTVNLHKLLIAALDLRPARERIVVIDGDFPTDRYIAAAIAERRGLELQSVAPDAVEDALDDRTAVLVASHVSYRSGRRFDAPSITARAHQHGALVIWDLSHSTGAVPVDLHAWDADLAVGCTYKYLNGGPGSPAYLFVSRRLIDIGAASPIPGWFGHDDPFAFTADYQPAGSADRFLAGTPPILSTLALEEALTLWDEVDLGEVTAKTRALTERFIDLADTHLVPLGADVASPRDADGRGGHVALRHDGGYAVMGALVERGVIGDHRPPDLLRFGLSPLTTRYVDVWDAVEVIRSVLASGVWRDIGRAPRVP